MGCAIQAGQGTLTTSQPPDVRQDEQAIREWFDDWIKASTVGDLDLAKSLIADDAVFLIPGFGKMGKEAYAAAATASDPNTAFELDNSIQEIEVHGNIAWLWSKLSLSMTNKTTQARTVMAGHSLAVLKRQGDGWVVTRDANTMVVVSQ